MAATPNSSAPSAPIKDDHKYDFMGDLDSIAKDENNKSRTWKLFDLTRAELFPETYKRKQAKKEVLEKLHSDAEVSNKDILQAVLLAFDKPDMLDKIGEAMGAVGVTAKAIGHDAYQALKMGAETIVSAVKHCSEKIGELGGQIKEKFGKVKSLISDMFKTIAKGLNEAKEKVKDKALEIIPDPVIKAAEKAAKTVKTAKQAVGKKASDISMAIKQGAAEAAGRAFGDAAASLHTTSHNLRSRAADIGTKRDKNKTHGRG